MAHIPYGYRIHRGKAVPEENEVRILNECIRLYLEGMSVRAAGAAAGLPMSASGLTGYLKKGVFAGTSYYPPLVEAGIHERILETMERRSHPGTRSCRPALPVYDTFVLAADGGLPGNQPAAGAVEALYRRILPSPSGRKVMAKEEIVRARLLLNPSG